MRLKYWRISQLGGHKPIEGLLIWRARTSPFNLILSQGGSSSPIYIPGEFWGIWSTGRGGPKLRGSAASRTM